MIKIPVLAAIVCLGLSFNAGAAEISAEALQLTPGQNQKLREMKEKLKYSRFGKKLRVADNGLLRLKKSISANSGIC